MTPKNFFAELKRRNVYKVALAYAIVGWLLIQVSTQVFPFFDIPNWGVRLIVLFIVIGFPVALIIAWAFELTSEGLKRTELADELPKKSARSRAWIYVVLIAAAISVGLFFLGRYTSSRQSAELPAKSIAVLPFDNQNRDPDTEYSLRRHSRKHHQQPLTVAESQGDVAQLGIPLQGKEHGRTGGSKRVESANGAHGPDDTTW